MNFLPIHTAIVILSGGYIEICCVNYDASELRRKWFIRRTVDFRHICWG